VFFAIIVRNGISYAITFVKDSSQIRAKCICVSGKFFYCDF